MRKRTLAKSFCALLFALYAVVMVILLFYYGRTPKSFRDLSLVPFATTKKFISLLGSGEPDRVLFAAKNLVGNVVMFIPLGFLLPIIRDRMKKAYVCLPVCAIVIVCVETIQYFTCLGTADIDDFLLNMIGVIIGFFAAKAILRKTEKKNTFGKKK